jgi:diguanylate cyclase (GGDEF)-like protein
VTAKEGERRVVVTDQDRADARTAVEQTARGTTIGGIAMVAVTNLLAGEALDAIAPGLESASRVVAVAAVSVLIATPLLLLVGGRAKARAVRSDSERMARDRVLHAESRRREFETRLASALEMAEQESDALDVVERALTQVVPTARAELLLADNSHAHLARVAASGDEPPGCPVDSPQSCVAARRGHPMSFRDGDDLDSCPKLRGRASGPCSAVCVPVSIMGRSVGVLHVAGDAGATPDDEAVAGLGVLANHVGNRIGMLRVMAETQLQASTDGLTGLLNRRAFENGVRLLRRQGPAFSLVMADLDGFKRLNDTHGHDVGDRALRVFAETLRSAVRPDDLVCRHGGEEFALALPDCSARKACDVMNRVREQLAATARRGEVPAFTASFGVVGGDAGEDMDELVARADAALYRAKAQGRDRVVVHGQHSADLGPLFASNGNAAHRALARPV